MPGGLPSLKPDSDGFSLMRSAPAQPLSNASSSDMAVTPDGASANIPIDPSFVSSPTSASGPRQIGGDSPVLATASQPADDADHDPPPASSSSSSNSRRRPLIRIQPHGTALSFDDLQGM